MAEVLDLQKIYPPESKIIQIEGSSKEDHVCTVRLKCATKDEFLHWLKHHQQLSGVTLRVSKTRPSLGLNVVYSAIYRCHHNTHPFSHARVKKPSAKHTGCEAKVKVCIKSSPLCRRVRSKDALRKEYPTIVTAWHKHNHTIDSAEALRFRDPTDAVRLKFIELFKSHHAPAKTLQIHKRDLLLQNKDNYLKVVADRSICPDVQWVYRLYYSTFKHVVNNTVVKVEPTDKQKVIVETVKTEPTAEPVLTIEDCEQKLFSVFNNIRLSLHRNPDIFACGINQFCSAFNSLKSDSNIVSALCNFGRESSSTLRAKKKNSTTNFVQPSVISLRKSAIKRQRCLRSRSSVKNSSTEHCYAKSTTKLFNGMSECFVGN